MFKTRGILLIYSIKSKISGDVVHSMRLKFWRRDYATEIAGELIKYRFIRLNLHRIIACCDTQNTSSAQVMANNHMQCEAHLVEHIWQRGKWRDSCQYAILEREWKANQNDRQDIFPTRI